MLQKWQEKKYIPVRHGLSVRILDGIEQAQNNIDSNELNTKLQKARGRGDKVDDDDGRTTTDDG
eukprot:5999000-Amphidinium_carterae.2